MEATDEIAPLAHRTDQALKRLGGIGRTTLYALWKAGRITPVHVGRVTLWPDSELRRLMAELVAEADADKHGAA